MNESDSVFTELEDDGLDIEAIFGGGASSENPFETPEPAQEPTAEKQEAPAEQKAAETSPARAGEKSAEGEAGEEGRDSRSDFRRGRDQGAGKHPERAL